MADKLWTNGEVKALCQAVLDAIVAESDRYALPADEIEAAHFKGYCHGMTDAAGVVARTLARAGVETVKESADEHDARTGA